MFSSSRVNCRLVEPSKIFVNINMLVVILPSNLDAPCLFFSCNLFYLICRLIINHSTIYNTRIFLVWLGILFFCLWLHSLPHCLTKIFGRIRIGIFYFLSCPLFLDFHFPLFHQFFLLIKCFLLISHLLQGIYLHSSSFSFLSYTFSSSLLIIFLDSFILLLLIDCQFIEVHHVLSLLLTLSDLSFSILAVL